MYTMTGPTWEITLLNVNPSWKATQRLNLGDEWVTYPSASVNVRGLSGTARGEPALVAAQVKGIDVQKRVDVVGI